MIEVRGLAIELGEFHLHDVHLKVESGQYGIVLGPTGAGKTVIIECIAGLHRPRTGQVLLDDVDVTELPPEQRQVAYVPQDYALFPHLKVCDNIAFGLRIAGWDAPTVDERVRELAELLHVDHLLERHPLHLSGGEKQRVAFARALAIRPRVLLLDEPLAAVDERTRERLTEELRGLQQALRATIIHVTHNFEEALALGDQIAVVSDGEVRQAGPPEEVFQRPCSTFVARFVGCANLLPGEVGEDGVFRGGELAVPADTDVRGPATLVIRPEEIRLGLDGVAERPGRIQSVVRGPHLMRVRLTAFGHELVALCSPDQARRLGLAPGTAVSLELPPERCHCIPDEAL